MDSEECHDKNAYQYQRMVSFFANRPIEPTNQFLHPTGRFKRRGGFKYHTQALAIRTKSLYVVRHPLVVAAVVLVLAAVFEEDAVELLYVIFHRCTRLEALKDHVPRIGIARNFLFVTAGE